MDHTYKFFNKRESFLSHPVDDISVMMSEVYLELQHVFVINVLIEVIESVNKVTFMVNGILQAYQELKTRI